MAGAPVDVLLSRLAAALHPTTRNPMRSVTIRDRAWMIDAMSATIRAARHVLVVPKVIPAARRESPTRAHEGRLRDRPGIRSARHPARRARPGRWSAPTGP